MRRVGRVAGVVSLPRRTWWAQHPLKPCTQGFQAKCDAAIQSAYEAGVSVGRMAELLRLSHQRVSQIGVELVARAHTYAPHPCIGLCAGFAA
jgi:hypothetical protein